MALRSKMPKMPFGKYEGVAVDKLPNSYLRWLITQKVPKYILEIAHEKLKNSEFNNEYVNISRHAIDVYSKRFLDVWASQPEMKIGLASWMAIEARRAYDTGERVSKNRHQDDGIARELDGLVWIFANNENFQDYLDVITVFSKDD